jgi:hypothetical protein
MPEIIWDLKITDFNLNKFIHINQIICLKELTDFKIYNDCQI